MHSPAKIESENEGDKAGVRTVQSIERGFALVDIIAQSGNGLTLAEISKRIGLHNSTTFHLLRTLCVIGCIKQDPDKRYRIGAYTYGLAAGAQTEANLVADALPHLERLATETGETTHIAVTSNDSVVILARYEGSSSVRFSERVGTLRPAYCTAIGKVLLTQLPDEKLKEYLERTTFEKFTENTVSSQEKFWTEIEAARQTGAAYDDREFNSEIRCIAAPVRNYTGKIVAALGLSGPVWRLTLQQVPKATDLVKSAANRLAHDLGFNELKGSAAKNSAPSKAS
jgi:DNA-binding IclR family transcriptional regulator